MEMRLDHGRIFGVADFPRIGDGVEPAVLRLQPASRVANTTGIGRKMNREGVVARLD